MKTSVLCFVLVHLSPSVTEGYGMAWSLPCPVFPCRFCYHIWKVFRGRLWSYTLPDCNISVTQCQLMANTGRLVTSSEKMMLPSASVADTWHAPKQNYLSIWQCWMVIAGKTQAKPAAAWLHEFLRQLSNQDVVMASSSTSATPPWPAPEAFIWSTNVGGEICSPPLMVEDICPPKYK